MKNLMTALTLLISVSAFAQGQFQSETVGMITPTFDKIMQLADVMPSDKYSWAPEEGVRSFAGVLQHVISVNYFFATKLGATLPEGVNMATLEEDLKTKEQLTKAVNQSSDLIIEAIGNVKTADLGNTIEFPFPGEYTTMTAILISLSHANEHLGQLIAYSRSNGVVPPWSQQ